MLQAASRAAPDRGVDAVGQSGGGRLLFPRVSSGTSGVLTAPLLGSGSSPASVRLSQPSMCWGLSCCMLARCSLGVGWKSWAPREGSRQRGARTALQAVDRCHSGGSRSWRSSFEHGAIQGWSQQARGPHTATPCRVRTGVDHRVVHGILGIPAPHCGPYPVAGLRGRFVTRWATFEAGLDLGRDTQQRIAERGAEIAITSQRVEALPATRARVRAIGSLWAYIYTVKFATRLRGCATRGCRGWETRTW